jgi:hypothetical protein
MWDGRPRKIRSLNRGPLPPTYLSYARVLGFIILLNSLSTMRWRPVSAATIIPFLVLADAR